MESALLSLFTLSFFLFAFGVAVAVGAIKTILEAIYFRLKIVIPDKFEGFLEDFWNEWVLPAAPVVAGGVLAFFLSDYPYPEGFVGSVSGRVLFGIIAGFFSGSVYRFAKYHLKKYLPEELQKKLEDVSNSIKSIPPPPEE